jgi:hypothetical protein
VFGYAILEFVFQMITVGFLSDEFFVGLTIKAHAKLNAFLHFNATHIEDSLYRLPHIFCRLVITMLLLKNMQKVQPTS